MPSPPPDPAGAGGEARWRRTDLKPWRGGGRQQEGRRWRPDGGNGLHLRWLERRPPPPPLTSGSADSASDRGLRRLR
uniref:Uncharacterized protein n=1 Tax=Oryza meridionalis TaxID=40149 RepID=A0A0E0CUV9_9ORYZ